MYEPLQGWRVLVGYLAVDKDTITARHRITYSRVRQQSLAVDDGRLCGHLFGGEADELAQVS